jgi:ankyrin repeat protein
MRFIALNLIASNKVDVNERGNFTLKKFCDPGKGIYRIEILEGVSALHVATLLGYYDFAKWLLWNGAYLSLSDAAGNSSMHYANFLKLDRIVKLFNNHQLNPFQNHDVELAQENEIILSEFPTKSPLARSLASDSIEIVFSSLRAEPDKPTRASAPQEAYMHDFHTNPKKLKRLEKAAKKARKHCFPDLVPQGSLVEFNSKKDK